MSRPDPVLLAMKAAAVALAVIAVLMLHQLVQHAQAVADHPCPPPAYPVLAPTGWGCAESLTIGVKSR